MAQIAGLFDADEARQHICANVARSGEKSQDACVTLSGRRQLHFIGDHRNAAGLTSKNPDFQVDDWDRAKERGALALVDRDARTLHLARDATGDYSLFYALAGETIAFASSPSDLFGLTGGIADHGGLAEERAGFAHSSRTAFDGIFRVLPGEHLVFRGGRVVERARVHPLAIEARDQALSPSDVLRSRALLDEAVGRCLPEDGLVASHLSSGRDSSTVTATAARLAPGRIVAFTGAPLGGSAGASQRGRFADESEAAADFARTLGIAHYTVRSKGRLFDHLASVVRTFQSCLNPVSNLSWFLGIADRAREAGCQSMLVGGMGNVTMNAGGLPALQDFWLQGRWFSFARQFTAAVRRDDVRVRGALAASFGPWMPPAFMRVLSARFADYAFPDPDRFIRSQWRRTRDDASVNFPSSRHWRAGFAQDFYDYDPGLRRLGMEIGFGLRERDPFADRALAQSLFRLPATAFIDRGHFRPFADAVLSDRLPSTILHAPRRGLQSADWLDRFDAAQAMEIVEEARASTSASEFLDLDRIALEIGELDRLKSITFGKQIGTGWHLMEALSLAVFLIQLERHSDAWGSSPLKMS